LGEDIDDTKPIVDGARNPAYEAFSKKPRRLRAGSIKRIDKPE